ncbi:MAG TPA: class I SAM-dependent methyltransferase [Terriglobia bacterium]|jgi:SAM-dependent methyltransferase
MTPEELHNIFRTEAELWWYRGMRSITRALADPVLKGNLRRGLDTGCGTGYNAREFESHYGLHMAGVDLAPLAIRYCHERGFACAAVASVMELPFPDGCFDLVGSIDVLPVLPPGGDEKALRELNRVLRPGGWLVLRVAAFRALRSRHSQYVAERHRYRASEMLRMLAALDFRVVRWTYANAFLSPVAWFKFRVWEPLRREAPHSGVAQVPPALLNRLLTAVLLCEAALIRRGFRFVFGQSWMAVAQKPPA